MMVGHMVAVFYNTWADGVVGREAHDLRSHRFRHAGLVLLLPYPRHTLHCSRTCAGGLRKRGGGALSGCVLLCVLLGVLRQTLR
jgi:hypothetical protein